MGQSKDYKLLLKQVWHFIWEDDSVWSWLLNILLAFLLVKFIIYPGLGLIFGTAFPVVAVVSGSMEHNGNNYDDWWMKNHPFYDGKDISKLEFEDFNFKNGFNKGDIMVLFGVAPEDVETGEVMVYYAHPEYPPIIHRVVEIYKEENGYSFVTKGDNNPVQDKDRVASDKVIGKAVLRIPYLGWVKIWFNDLVRLVLSIFIGGLR